MLSECQVFVLSLRLKNKSGKRTLNVLHCIFVGKKVIACSKNYLIQLFLLLQLNWKEKHYNSISRKNKAGATRLSKIGCCYKYYIKSSSLREVITLPVLLDLILLNKIS